MGICESHSGDQCELGHHVGLPGHREGCDRHQEQEIPSLKLHLGKAVSRKAAGQHLERGGAHCDLEGIFKEG